MNHKLFKSDLVKSAILNTGEYIKRVFIRSKETSPRNSNLTNFIDVSSKRTMKLM